MRDKYSDVAGMRAKLPLRSGQKQYRRNPPVNVAIGNLPLNGGLLS
jgi:hypothetical protein